MTLPFSVLLITDWSRGPHWLLGRVARALEAGPGVAVQHRHPGATDAQHYDEGLSLARLCAAAGAPLFVNGRVDLALALDAHLHCTTRSLRPDQVRALLPSRWISTVVHGVDDTASGADLALVSPVFTPTSKPGDTRPPLGPEGFSALAARLPCPAFALGGITPASAARLGHPPGVAVISAVLEADDPAAAAAALLRATRR
ncbi:MAG: thiamine phosphate synthase [Myxococcaceae bacterium]|jgi:thiamine-phosphate pyrophosphorylase|nr:thiamine phosphate synthase [Myxococcaceae bacterium]MCA3014589.1 thiamine phosphate synthase [Myxococcaceae bacterium]